MLVVSKTRMCSNGHELLCGRWSGIIEITKNTKGMKSSTRMRGWGKEKGHECAPMDTNTSMMGGSVRMVWNYAT